MKFKKFGSFNKSGWEESCENYNPKACFAAMKTKTCLRKDCNFFHLTGTKKMEGPNVNTANLPTILTQNSNTFTGDATRLWNKAPKVIRNVKSIKMAKKVIKLHCKNYPI